MKKALSDAPLGRNPVAPEWCLVCGSRHATDARCPGRLEPTGPERQGWKVVVETPHSMEAYGVLVAPVGTLWRARILTFPRSLWTVPGGHAAMKFLAATPPQAEEQAIRYIEQHCALRRYTPRHGLELAELRPSQLRGPARTTSVAPPRWPLVLPVVYGLDALSRRGVTRNVSEGGVFVQTPAPIPDGSDLMLQLTVKTERVPLQGNVVWIRSGHRPGRPPGMGIRLVMPPRAYLEYVRSLPPPGILDEP